MTFMSEYLELKHTGCLPLQRSTKSLPEHVHRLSSLLFYITCILQGKT